MDIWYMIGIYLIENNINHKKYIGQSVNIYQRWATHRRAYSSTDISFLKTCPLLYDAFKKYGIENFSFSVLEEVLDPKNLDEKETFYIQTYNTIYPSGYNVILPNKDMRGEQNPKSKITESQVETIKTILKDSTLSISDIAQNYGLSLSTIYRINNGEIWYSDKNHYPIREWNLEARTGSVNGMSKITEQEVLFLRQQYITHSIKELYEQNNYGYSFSGFKKVIQGATFKNVPIYKKSFNKWLNN